MLMKDSLQKVRAVSTLHKELQATRNAENHETVFPREEHVVLQYQMIIPENTHRSNIIHIETAVFRNMCA